VDMLERTAFDSQIAEQWMRDFPQQFQGRRNIECLVRAFARQLKEVQDVFRELEKLDLETAKGKNLDMVGDIVGLTRKEAGILAGASSLEPVISDSRYRQYLRYKQLQNTAEGTYEDVMKSVDLLWNTDQIQYEERLSRPATIFIQTKSVEIDTEKDPIAERTPVVKPAGIAVIYKGSYVIWADNSHLEQILFQNLLLQLYLAALHNQTAFSIHTRFQQGFTTSEEIRLPSIQLAWQLPSRELSGLALSLTLLFPLNFWGSRLWNGSRRLDGSKRLDGRRRYRLLLDVAQVWRGKRIPERFLRPSMALTWEQRLSERMEADRIESRMKINFREERPYPFHAKTLLDIKVVSTGQEQIGSVMVTVKTREYRFLDGSRQLDGSRNLNSVYRKEMV
jgi:hypothetical protein